VIFPVTVYVFSNEAAKMRATLVLGTSLIPTEVEMFNFDVSDSRSLAYGSLFDPSSSNACLSSIPKVTKSLRGLEYFISRFRI